MVLEIALTNFFSINEKVILDMQAANIQTKEARALDDNTFNIGNERLLKTVAIYGAARRRLLTVRTACGLRQ